MPAAIGTTRGCGSRDEGGVYLESALSDHGLPLEDFLVDPPIPVDPDMDKITAIGIELFDGPDGTVHVLDWIGEVHYPYPTDFLEEGRRKGFSRRVSPATEFWRLTPYKSRIFTVHAKGFITNWRDYFDAEIGDPHRRDGHAAYRHCRLWNQGDLSHVEQPITSCSRYAWSAAPGTDGSPMRRFTDFEYRVFPPSVDVTPVFSPAIVASLPVTNLTVIKARDGSHVDTATKLRDEARLLHVAIAPS